MYVPHFRTVDPVLVRPVPVRPVPVCPVLVQPFPVQPYEDSICMCMCIYICTFEGKCMHMCISVSVYGS